jgi:phosphotransferase system  glucose/maltose/N-acetylglucosamine-specific IIC component
MYRYLFRFFVISVTILTANLITTYISDYLITYKNHVKQVTFTFVAMGIIVLIFYPLFIRLQEWVKKLSMKLMKSGKNLAGRYVGLFLAFIAALLILFYFYAKMWYGIDFVKVLLQGRIGNYI